jgi:hypothetical protein
MGTFAVLEHLKNHLEFEIGERIDHVLLIGVAPDN